MPYQFLLPFCGLLLILMGARSWPWGMAAIWLGCNFVALGIAHALGLQNLFGKDSRGVIPLWSWVLFFPYLFCSLVIWHILRLVSREPAWNAVSDELVVGRRLLPSELPGEFSNYVDLAGEFSEPRVIRARSGYVSFPILDAGTPDLDSLRKTLTALRPGRTFVHCAQGHGRTGTFALALLLARGAIPDVESGLRMLQAVRPGIRLNKAQRNCVTRFAEQLRKSGS